jgi:protein kinase A
MPTLGFLKKKRTKEASGSKDLASPTSTSQPGTPITPTSSKGFEEFVPSEPESTPILLAQSTTASNQDTRAVTADSMSMKQGVAAQRPHAESPLGVGNPVASEQQNLPSISNLINPQHDGALQSHPAQLANSSATYPANTSFEEAQKAITQVQQQKQARATKGKYTLGDFEILRTLGTGSFGRVHLVQSKHNKRFYAVKVLKKHQVVKMKQVEHTNDERKMLQEVKHPFLITLWGTFQDSRNLYMVMDFVEGGELFSLLRKSQVRFLMYSSDHKTKHVVAVPKSCSEILCR